MSGRRKLLFGAVVLATLLAILEGAAWLADARVGFRRELLQTLEEQRIFTEPIAGRSELPWPGDLLLARSDVDGPALTRPYVLGRRVIPGAHPNARQVLIHPTSLPDDRYRRVFVVGGSAAFGFPYRYAETFCGALGRTTENHLVVNCAQTSWTSGQLVPIVGRIVDRFEPDVLVIFTGNNEWIHWMPPSQSRMSEDRRRALCLLAGSRALAAVEYCAMRWARSRNPVAAENALRIPQPGFFSSAASSGFVSHQEIIGAEYAAGHPLERYAEFDAPEWLQTKRKYLRTYEENLTRMVTLATSRGVRVILLTIPFAYRLCPAWKHPQPESFDPACSQLVRDRIRRAVRLLREGDDEQALPLVRAALEQDPLPPILNYLQGQCLERAGRDSQAEQSYARCRENMIGNLGSCLSINATIRKVARATGAELLDVRGVFDAYEHAQGRYFNEDLIGDDCHPTPLGHRLIARELARLLGNNQQ